MERGERGRGRHISGRHDPLVVRGSEIVPYLEEWRREVDAANGGVTPQTWETEPHLSGIDVLIVRSGVTSRTLRRIFSGETKWVGDALVESLFVTGMGRPDLYAELKLVPNPMWSQERWLKWKAGCETD